MAFSENMETCISNFGDLPECYSHWIVKFRNDSRHGDGDPVDIGRLEMAYADMARAAGLQVPNTRLIELTVNRKEEAFFAVQRFDREVNRKIHFLSLAGYAYADHRVPCLDYGSGVLAATKKITKSDKEVEKARSGPEKSGAWISDISASMSDGSRRSTGAESNEKTPP